MLKPVLAAAVALALYGCTTSAKSVDPITTSSVQHYPSSDLKGLKDHVALAAFTPQTAEVRTRCFPASLRNVLRQIQKKYGRTPVVTSGHRRDGRSQHTGCRAADIRVPGVAPSRVAAFARTIPGIGGVGTYCRKSIVHVDVGPRRDWRHC